MKVKFAHIRSHRNLRNDDAIKGIKHHLEEWQVNLNKKTAKMFGEMNALADILATGITENLVFEDKDKSDGFTKLQWKGGKHA
jgi:hypothetical protein